MVVDARALPDGQVLTADVCIVGSGAAGLTLARELADRGVRTIVLEGGGETRRHADQQLFEGIVDGTPYYPLDECRVRMLGGSTSVWGGWCRALDAIDFEPRSWVPGSGWPFAAAQLSGAFARAASICGVGPSRDATAARSLSSGTRSFHDVLFGIRATRFGEACREALRASRCADLVLHANVLEIVMDRQGRSAVTVRAAARAGRSLTVSAGAYVLAAGGIENARLLLASRGAGPGGIGNEHDLVGRCFADHLHVPIAVIDAADVDEFYGLHQRGGMNVRGGIAPTARAQRTDRLLGFGLTFHDAGNPHDVFSPAQVPRSYLSLHHLATSLRRFRRPDRFAHHARNVLAGLPEAARLAYRRLAPPRRSAAVVVCYRGEQAPNHDSRITLAPARDALGMPRVRLQWRLLEQDLENIGRAQDLVARELRSFSLAPIGAHHGRATLMGAAHHIGTTRMHADARHGVVDEHGRVHGTANLYVAGSSIFPTSGWAPPTFTIVALALRLADHLAQPALARDIA